MHTISNYDYNLFFYPNIENILCHLFPQFLSEIELCLISDDEKCGNGEALWYTMSSNSPGL